MSIRFAGLFLAGLALAHAPLAAQADSLPLSADSVSLSVDDALRRALERGDEVRLAEERRDAANAQIGVARAGGLPQLRFNSTFSHVYENARAQAVGQIFNQPNTYNTNFNLSVPLFQGGRVGAALRGARGLRGAAEADIEDTRAEVTLLVLRSYLNALLAARLVEIQENNLRQAEARLAQVEQFERAGRAARYDVLRARVERANLEPLLIQARGDREVSFVELRRLINLPPATPVRLVTGLRPEEVRVLAARVEAEAAAVVEQPAALDELPAVRAARLRADASRAAVSAARADYLPTVSLTLQSGWQAFPQEATPPFRAGGLREVECPADSDPGRVCTQQNGGWFSDRQMGIQVSWPVFDGLRARSNVALARANHDVARVQARQALELAQADAERARAELRRTVALFEASRQTVAEAEEAFRLATLRYQRGLGTQLEVSDAQLALLTARTNEARATHDLYLATAELARAAGRPVPLPSGAPAPAAATTP